MATVFIPTVLRPFSNGRERVSVSGRTLRQVIDQLDGECPGIKAQIIEDDDIRPGLAIAIDGDVTSEGLVQAIGEETEVHILPAIGGG
jgi:hypothetical protein